MGIFDRRKAPSDDAGVSTFVEATGGGWRGTPDRVSVDGGSQAEYVRSQLELAREQAMAVEVGEKITYTLTDIPRGIASPVEILFGLMMLAREYDLRPGVARNETIEFTRLS